MKKTDIGIVAFMYGVCVWFTLMNRTLPADAQIYPRLIIVILALLTTMYVAKMVVTAKKAGVTSGLAELFKGFLPRQFFTVLGSALGYLAALYLIGFYPATVIFMIAVLISLRIKPLTIAITTASILALVFVTFNVILKVSLMKGLVFELLL
ncbi:MAG: tripartite tricarboxylate transporter TctB family protein [Treponema sp.]|nr:tripartite tricarboxylate transporter TctB family protein [Treponema sp.]